MHGGVGSFAFESSLAEAIQRGVAAWADRSGVAAAIDAHGGEAADARTRDALIDILEEALRNVGRHAEARHVIVALRERGTNLELMVADDGHGFDRSSNGDLRAAGRYGLERMSQRAEALGGRLGIKSSPGAGTELRVQIPGRSGMRVGC